jgi:hypothetical protein
MKTLKFLTPFFLLFAFYATSNAQSTTDPDSVCAGAMGKSYKVSGTAGSTYQWFVNGGTQASGGSTDSVTINWSSIAGVDTLKVLEFNTIGCPGDTIRLAVVRLPLPTVALSGTDSICLNSATVSFDLKMAFTGVGPWTVGYTEAGTARSVTTNSNPYTFNSQVFGTSGIKNYAVTTITARKGCSGSFSGGAAVTVFPKPSTSAITHY